MIKTLFFASLLVASSLPGAARAAGADEAFTETREAYQALKKDPERRKFRHHWLNMAHKLEAFGKRYPKSEKTPDVLYMTGDLYATLWRFSQDPDDLKPAEQAWRKLVDGFPSHRLADDAALQLARQLADRRGELEEARRVVEAALPHAKDRKKELEELLVGLKEARKKKGGSDDAAVAQGKVARGKAAAEEPAHKGRGGDEEKPAAAGSAAHARAEAKDEERGHGGRDDDTSRRGGGSAEEKGAAARRGTGESSDDDKPNAHRSAAGKGTSAEDDKPGALASAHRGASDDSDDEKPAATARRGAADKGSSGADDKRGTAASAHRGASDDSDDEKPLATARRGAAAKGSSGPDDKRGALASAHRGSTTASAEDKPSPNANARRGSAEKGPASAEKPAAVAGARREEAPKAAAVAARRTLEARPELRAPAAVHGSLVEEGGSARRLADDSGDDASPAEAQAARSARPASAGGKAQDVLAAIRKVSAQALRTSPALDAGVDARHATRAAEPREETRSDEVEEQGQSSALVSLQERLRDVRVGSRRVDEAAARSRVKGLSAAEAATELSLSQQLGLKMRRVVVDAGHGGHDTGAIGPKGTREKDVALSIAKRLARKLEAMGLEVVLTRDDDSFVALEERTAIANRERGDLFISVHCNAAPSKALRGVETYSLNTASTRYGVRLAARENASSERGVSDLQYILADLATKANTGESERLAQRVQKSMVRSLNEKHPGVRDLGPKQALFFVLLGAKMPAILVETSFISNPQEEELLGTDAYQDDAANGVAGAVQDFLDERNRVAQVD